MSPLKTNAFEKMGRRVSRASQPDERKCVEAIVTYLSSLREAANSAALPAVLGVDVK